MTTISLPAAPPSWRLGLSILASLLLHGVLLWPFGLALRPPAPLPPPLLEAVLLAPALTSRKPADEAAPAAEPDSGTTLQADADAVPPAPTFPVRPRELRGRELKAALAALAQLDFYPREAIERGLEGDVIVLLTLTPQGNVTHAAVASSSGQRLLDEAALSAVRSLTGLPATQRQVLLSVKFRLD